MHQASVGYHCPSCVRGHAAATKPARKALQTALHGHRPMVTMAIMAVAGLVYAFDISQGANPVSGENSLVVQELSVWAIGIERGEWWRVVTSGFGHIGLIHIGFNMWLLWMLGQGLEGRFGPINFGLIYLAGIIGGSLGALLVEPRSAAVGASGAVFALMGLTLVLQKVAGQNIFQSGIGGLVLINILFSFRGGVSLGGHLGGLVVGVVIGFVIVEARKRRLDQTSRLAPMLLILIGLLSIAIAPAVNRAVAFF